MKYWIILANIFLLGTYNLLAQKNEKLPAYQNKGTRDVSQNAWSSWEAPVSTVDPSELISNDSASNGVSDAHLSSPKANSFQFASALGGSKPVQIEKSKPIQEIEGGAASPADVQPTPTVAVATPKRSSNRIIWIAVISVAILAYRKFRRNAGPYPPKPSFL